MIQEKILLYDSIYKTDPGTTDVLITIQPESLAPNALEADLNFEIGKTSVNNNSFLEGQLCIVMKNNLKEIDFEIDDDGNLIVHGRDADNYNIDADGNLIYSYR